MWDCFLEKCVISIYYTIIQRPFEFCYGMIADETAIQIMNMKTISYHHTTFDNEKTQTVKSAVNDKKNN